MDSAEIISLTQQLIAVPSVAGDSSALHTAIDFIAAMLADIPGITVERFKGDKPSLLAYKGATRPDKFAIILHGHVDVVPGKPEQFIPEIRDGRLYGRGAHDMKTAAIVMTDVFREMVTQVPYALGLQIVTDEEIGGLEGARYHIQQGLRTDFAITGEQNFHDNAIYNAARGICWLEIEFSGETAHGAYVWHGVNAADKAAAFANTLGEYYPRPSEETWTTTASVASIQTTNTTYNKIPDHALLKIDFRFTAEDPTFTDKESVAAFVRQIDPSARIVDFAFMDPAVYVHEHNPYLQALAASLQRVTHKTVHFAGRPATSDGRHYAAKGMDVVEYGITGNGPHSDNEYIELNSIPTYAATLRDFLDTVTLANVSGKVTTTHGNSNRANIITKARRAPHSQRKILAE